MIQASTVGTKDTLLFISTKGVQQNDVGILCQVHPTDTILRIQHDQSDVLGIGKFVDGCLAHKDVTRNSGVLNS